MYYQGKEFNILFLLFTCFIFAYTEIMCRLPIITDPRVRMYICQNPIASASNIVWGTKDSWLLVPHPGYHDYRIL